MDLKSLWFVIIAVLFGGFFVLRDFHRDHLHDGRHSVVSNHFNDVSAHRVFRVDPVNRHNGRTYAGVGAPKANNFIGTGVQRSPERIFNNRPPTRPGSVTPQKKRDGQRTCVKRIPRQQSISAEQGLQSTSWSGQDVCPAFRDAFWRRG